MMRVSRVVTLLFQRRNQKDMELLPPLKHKKGTDLYPY
jgi:hypothetical protein